MKTAVIYDKWLSSLGGGEVVACHFARILKNEGYRVIFVSGKLVSPEKIKDKLGIDIKGIEFQEVWNDEKKLKKIVERTDLFINISFLDYSFGYAKINIYYSHFPTQIYHNFKGRIINSIILPLSARLIKPEEFIEGTELIVNKWGRMAYMIKEKSRLAFSYLNTNKKYTFYCLVFFENFYFDLIKGFKIEFENSEVLSKKIKVRHNFNMIEFSYDIKPLDSTIFVKTVYDKTLNGNLLNDAVYLIDPRIINYHIPKFLYYILYDKVNARLRAGIFLGLKAVLSSYQLIVTHSQYVNGWILKYWHRRAEIIYPPVEMILKENKNLNYKKENWICSVGRFFTLGHGKKQEVMIDAFIRLYKNGFKDWELHLVGGVGNEKSSLEFIEALKDKAKGFPIHFHFNVSRNEVRKVLLKSKIYWHATGIGENTKKDPIKFEHFGIAPVEAISAKCIPILYNGGGLTEIVEILEFDKTRNLFNTVGELIANTEYFINHKSDINWPVILKKTEENFSTKSFEKKFVHLIESLA